MHAVTHYATIGANIVAGSALFAAIVWLLGADSLALKACAAVLLLSLWPRAHRLMYATLRWPVIWLVWSCVSAELVLYWTLRFVIKLMEVRTTDARERRCAM